MTTPTTSRKIKSNTSQSRKVPRLNIGSVDIAEDEIDWMEVICNLAGGESLRSQVKQILSEHLERRKIDYIRKIGYFARKYDLSWEQAFVLLKEKKPPYSTEDFEWATSQNALAIREEEILFSSSVNKPEEESSDTVL